ncbi:MAG: M20 family metallopeptidase, partial [Synergistaceae bacterium]|nr:M20 family metallopeptidase [Synergistaceae bacterium]
KKAPLNMPKDSILIKKLQKVYEEKTGQEAKLLSMGGGTYAKALPNIVAFGPKFPESPDVAHQADEFIDLEEYLKILQIMGTAMVELAN